MTTDRERDSKVWEMAKREKEPDRSQFSMMWDAQRMGDRCEQSQNALSVCVCVFSLTRHRLTYCLRKPKATHTHRHRHTHGQNKSFPISTHLGANTTPKLLFGVLFSRCQIDREWVREQENQRERETDRKKKKMYFVFKIISLCYKPKTKHLISKSPKKPTVSALPEWEGKRVQLVSIYLNFIPSDFYHLTSE